MTNVEARRNDKIAVIRSCRPRLRHSGFVINSSFVIRISSFRAESAVTIIELRVVIMVILVLAGLVLAACSYVQNNGARARAETEIAALSAALESYKADNGIYPYTTNTNNLDISQTNPSGYQTASLELYKALSGDQDANGVTDANQKSYFSFRPQMLGHVPPTNTAVVSYIRDPWGNSYGYSTSKNPIANPSGYTSATGANPTFDLWSTAGPTPAPAPSPIQNVWIKNW